MCFFFKKKTVYELQRSDLVSDLCYSVLKRVAVLLVARLLGCGLERTDSLQNKRSGVETGGVMFARPIRGTGCGPSCGGGRGAWRGSS